MVALAIIIGALIFGIVYAIRLDTDLEKSNDNSWKFNKWTTKDEEKIPIIEKIYKISEQPFTEDSGLNMIENVNKLVSLKLYEDWRVDRGLQSGYLLDLISQEPFRDISNNGLDFNNYLKNKNIFLTLQKSEQILWVHPVVKMYKERQRTQYKSSGGGFRIKITKGLYYNTRNSTTTPITENFNEYVDIGHLVITNKHLIFSGESRSYKVAFSKIVGIQSYSDGVEIIKEGVEKNTSFTNFDNWFLLNLLSLI